MVPKNGHFPEPVPKKVRRRITKEPTESKNYTYKCIIPDSGIAPDFPRHIVKYTSLANLASENGY